MKKDIKEMISYLVAGILTTLVNYVVYFGLIPIFRSYLVRNTLAWLVAVCFAYFVNKKFVFHSKNDSIKEGSQFFLLRLVTLLVENGLLIICIQVIQINEPVSKILISIVTVLGNYFLCKYKIFRKTGELHG